MSIVGKAICCYIFFYSTIVISSELSHQVNQTIKRFENEYYSKIEGNKTPKELFEATVDLAKILKSYGYYDYALEYYKKSLDVKAKGVDYIAPYIDIISIYQVVNKNKDAIKWKEFLEERIKQNPIFKSFRSYNQFLYKKVLMTDRPSKLVLSDIELTRLMSSNLYLDILWHDSYAFLRMNNIDGAYNSITMLDVTNSSITDKALFDLIVYMKEKSKNQTFMCNDTLKKYPKSKSYSIQICRILNKAKQGRPISDKLKHLRNYLRQYYPQKLFLVEAMKKYL